MKTILPVRLFFIVLTCAFLQSSASYGDERNLGPKDFLPGDIVFVSLNCMECKIIEIETASAYSHVGVILSVTNTVVVAEALGKVHSIPLAQFLNRQRPQSSHGHYRSQHFAEMYERIKYHPQRIASMEKELAQVFVSKYLDALFDGLYLWDNFDPATGREKFYCSEFVSKFLNEFLTDKILPYPLLYAHKEFEDFWLKKFHGIIPRGVLGNSPQSLIDSNLFIKIE